MSTLYERRKEEFIDFINTNHTLPRVWKDKFIDGEDMRIWFNKIYKNSKFKDFIKQVNILLNKYNIKILNDKEKEQEFIIKVLELDRVPKKIKNSLVIMMK